jgi:hypothetical protein
MLKVISEKLEFDSTNPMSDKWRELIKEEQDKANIHFDLENDESVGKIKRITRPADANHRDKDIFYVQLYSAGGDWEQPVYYFRIQVKEGYPSRQMFIYIPDKKDGNGNLTANKNGLAPVDASDYNHEDGRDEKKAWDAVERFLKKWEYE